MSFHFRSAAVSDFAGKQVKVAKVETLYCDSDSEGEQYVRQLVVYEADGELASEVIEVRESKALKEGDVITLPE
jgi:hypothetical protein